jgi:hypothetical protein
MALLKANGEPGGYVLVSDHPHIPKIVEYSLHGPPLSAQLMRYWFALNAAGIDVPVKRMYYLGPFDLAVRLAGPPDDQGELVAIPFGDRLKTGALARDPRQTWPSAVVRRVDKVITNIASKSPQPLTIVELPRKPVRYTQNCSSGLRKVGHPPASTPCSPACISGCGPVAWAMLASAYRQGYEHNPMPGNQYGNLFKGSSDWNVEWPSIYQPNPSRSQMVNETIWGLHSVMHTGCDGSTSYGGSEGHQNIFQNAWQYICDRYKASLASSLWGYNDFATHAHFVGQGTPLMFCGSRNWGRLLVEQQSGPGAARREKTKRVSTGSDGHCVVVYGYDDALRYDLICMGWGTFFQDKFIAPESVADGIIIFNARPSPDAALDLPTRKVRRGTRPVRISLK